jgi:hypothetical protein
MNTKHDQRRARALTFMLSLGMLAGVLIWAKLRLVTDLPRSALAVPEEVEQTERDPEIADDQGGLDEVSDLDEHLEHEQDD